jgi:integrase
VREGIATLKTEKSGFQIEVTIPLLPPLVEALRAGPTGDLAFICGGKRKPLTKESFGNAFRDACRAAGVNKTRAANNGATVAELEAIFGWTGGNMASLYTREADRRRLARDAMGKLWNRNSAGTSIPAPDHKVRGSERKTL